MTRPVRPVRPVRIRVRPVGETALDDGETGQMVTPFDPGSTTCYRLAGGLVLRIVGLLVIVVALVVVVTSLAAFLIGIPVAAVVILALVGVVGATGTGWWLRARASVVRLTPEGYDVHLVRGAGARSGRWSEVEEMLTTSPNGIACVVVKGRSGATTTIPVAALAADREEFVRDLQGRLQAGHGLRPLDDQI